MSEKLTDEAVKMLMAQIRPAGTPIVTVTKPSGTSGTLLTSTPGLYQPLSAMYTRMQRDYGWPIGYYCARCEERIQYDRDGFRKNRGKPAWTHIRTSSPWCPVTKQHGPKTRYVLPVPSLYVINEIGYVDA